MMFNEISVEIVATVFRKTEEGRKSDGARRDFRELSEAGFWKVEKKTFSILVNFG